MSILLSIIFAGIINYLTRLGSVLAINPKKMNNKTKLLLSYVPSVFLNQENELVHFSDPKVVAISLAFVIGVLTQNLIITIISGLISFWTILFLL